MKFNLFHIGDAHLGFFSRDNPEKEGDVYNAWMNACRDIVLRHEDGNIPSVVLICGDIFDTPKPPLSALRYAIEGLNMMSEAGIKTIVITGNHDVSRIEGKERPAEILNIHNVTIISKPRAKKISLDDGWSITIIGVPYHYEQSALDYVLKRLIDGLPNSEKNINAVMMHNGYENTLYGDEAQLTKDAAMRMLVKGVDYIALGHYHPPEKVYGEDYIYMAGSLERLTRDDDGDKSYRHMIFKDRTIIKDELVPTATSNFRVVTVKSDEVEGDLSDYVLDLVHNSNTKDFSYLDIFLSQLQVKTMDINELRYSVKKANPMYKVNFIPVTSEDEIDEISEDLDSIDSGDTELSVEAFVMKCPDYNDEQRETIMRIHREALE